MGKVNAWMAIQHDDITLVVTRFLGGQTGGGA